MDTSTLQAVLPMKSLGFQRGPPMPIGGFKMRETGYPRLFFTICNFLQELAQLGGGVHETICASVQEHIADTYLGYEGVQGVLSESGDDVDGAGANARGNQRNRQKGSVVKAATAAGTAGASEQRLHSRTPWTVDENGEVWTRVPPASRPASTGVTQKGRGRSAVKNEAVRETALGLEGFRPGVDGQPISGSSQFGSGGGTTDVASDRKAEQLAENLDKAQVGQRG